MTKRSPDQSPNAADQQASEPSLPPEALESKLKKFGGSNSDVFNQPLLESVLNATWISERQRKENRMSPERLAASIALGAFRPASEVEGLLAAQLVAAHQAAMESYRRAAITDISYEIRDQNLNQAVKLSRTFAVLLETLQKYRGKGQQKVTVEHVHVYEGGQAIVGNVTRGVGGRKKSEEQPHAKQFEDAQEPPMSGQNTV